MPIDDPWLRAMYAERYGPLHPEWRRPPGVGAGPASEAEVLEACREMGHYWGDDRSTAAERAGGVA